MNIIKWIMKNIIFLLLLTVSNISFTQNRGAFKAFLDHKQFFHPDLGNLLEIHIQFIAYSLTFKQTDEGLQSIVGINYKLKNLAQEIIHADAYQLKSPIMRDSIIEDFYELKRIALKPGTYTLELTLYDLNADTKQIETSQTIDIIDYANRTTISSIEPAELIQKTKEETVFTKSGYDIIPRISNYYSTDVYAIPVYLEIYSNEKEVVGLKQVIRNVKSKQELEQFTKFSKLEVDKIAPQIKVIDISSLPTGEYHLEFSLINKNNEEFNSTSYFFERLNTNYEVIVENQNIVLDPGFQTSIVDDSLKFYLASLIPISSKMEVKNIIKILKTENNEYFRKYLQSYWTLVAAGENVTEKWLKYKSQVQLVQRLYSNNFMDGFETDRGRVYLMYGAPSNIISREVSASEVPYEIWRYDKLKQFSNRRFIFYNTDLVNNNYRLLHSDVIGEVKNPRWQQFLNKRQNYNTDVYNSNDGIEDNFGNKASEFFNQY
jgi:GWxTD domain-containing protein